MRRTYEEDPSDEGMSQMISQSQVDIEPKQRTTQRQISAIYFRRERVPVLDEVLLEAR